MQELMVGLRTSGAQLCLYADPPPPKKKNNPETAIIRVDWGQLSWLPKTGLKNRVICGCQILNEMIRILLWLIKGLYSISS